ncbi:hypothetical protein [Micromonospora sp. M61]|uniref:hypothetical protein n=1 Tax=Micromonospora sp. M61 TaxID=2824890 RepID=UPI001B3925CF|nr:hypothetical protein [Micromonospora sp. M61]
MHRPNRHVVTYAVSEADAGPTAVSATSLLENSPSDDFHFAVLDLGLRPETKQSLSALLGHGRLEFLDPAAGAPLPPGELGVAVLLSEMLAEAHHRIIHLACATLVVGDLSPLISIDLDGCPVAGAPRFAQPGSGDIPSIDPGVLVIDTRTLTEDQLDRRGVPPRWKRLGLEWHFPVLDVLRREWNGPLPVVYRFGDPHHLPDMRVMYDEYRRRCIAAGGPTF